MPNCRSREVIAVVSWLFVDKVWERLNLEYGWERLQARARRNGKGHITFPVRGERGSAVSSSAYAELTFDYQTEEQSICSYAFNYLGKYRA